MMGRVLCLVLAWWLHLANSLEVSGEEYPLLRANAYSAALQQQSLSSHDTHPRHLSTLSHNHRHLSTLSHSQQPLSSLSHYPRHLSSLPCNQNEALPLCTRNRHAAGQWVYHTDKTEKSFFCCGLDNNEREFLVNTTACGNETRREHIDFKYKGSNEIYAHAGGGACRCDARSERGRLAVSEREKYEWVPSYCRLKAWDGRDFCRLLGDRKIVMVGDSTMEQTASSLMAMVFAHRGGCAEQIVLYRSDFLVFGTRGHRDLKEALAVEEPDIVVMCGGAHFRDFGDIVSTWERALPDIKKYLESHPQAKFLWKSQNPAHLFCERAQGKPFVQYAPGPVSADRWKWLLHYSFDEYSYNMSLVHPVQYLDFSPLYLRPDAHTVGDCLHYCIPGPIDIIGPLLLTMMHTGEL